MNINELVPPPDKKALFKLSSFKMIPNISGCYLLTTFEGEILYIGLSDDLSRRFKQHLDNPEKIRTTVKGRAIWFYFLNYNYIHLERLERTWLNQFVTKHGKRPILNKVNSPIN